MPLTKGSLAPDFNLLDENENPHQLSVYQGAPVVLYFYPKDDTPGCTKEACGFRDGYSAYEEAGVTILGVSPDTPQKHLKFKTKYQLPFTLLADPDHEVCELYGVWGRKKFMGRAYDGVFRTTYIINAVGEIADVFENVKPANHSTEILQALHSLG
jgi:peroxiredoxin Q/BCP